MNALEEIYVNIQMKCVSILEEVIAVTLYNVHHILLEIQNIKSKWFLYHNKSTIFMKHCSLTAGLKMFKSSY